MTFGGVWLLIFAVLVVGAFVVSAPVRRVRDRDRRRAVDAESDADAQIRARSLAPMLAVVCDTHPVRGSR